MFDTRLMAVAVVALLVLPAGSAAAANETVQTPAGTYHVTADTDVSEPSVGIDSQDFICIKTGGFEYCVPLIWPQVDPGVSANATVYEESNGCEGLQTQAQDCDDDGDEEPADRLLLAYEDSDVRQGIA